MHLGKLYVVDCGRDKGVVEVPCTELCNLLKRYVFELFKALALFRASHDHEHSIIRTHAGTGTQIEGFLLLVYINVNDARTSVAQDRTCNVSHCRRLEIRSARESPAKRKHFSLKSINVSNYWRGEGRFFLELELRD